ncbi:MAG: hypothetical protein IAC55_03360 [Tyzzerella sp.]|uniref:DNA 5'-3' helicase n=1 Tax=Candidatus Fimicola merdigallinarum TaxID=2840819 RepID=A0A9D9H378_9FIRM|nr:hypothetical protein [Candidatus Fimicola merdigallinarum]
MVHIINNPTSERSLLSLCLNNADLLVEVEGAEVFSQHFTIPAHRHIFTAMMYLYSKGITPTPISIIEVITDKKAKEEIEEFGGLSYIEDMTLMDIDKSNLKIFCQKIKQTYARKEIYDICESTKNFMLSDESETLNPSELVGMVESKITEIACNTVNENGVHKMGTGLKERLEERAKRPTLVAGLEVGWEICDRVTNGGQAGDLIIVCARAKMGKSVVLTTWAKKFSVEDELPVLYIDTEMTSEEQEDRIVSMITKIPVHEIVTGLFAIDTEEGTAKEKIAKIKDAIDLINKSPYYHVYMPNFSSEKVVSLAKQYKSKYNIQALFFDYIKVPASGSSTLNSMKEYQALGFFTSTLKDLAGILKIPVYSAVQENRNDEKGTEKGAGNVAGSDRILQLATKLMFLYAKTDEQIARDSVLLGNRQLKIAYQRNGESDVAPINLQFDNKIVTIKEV